ncbi:hypothetical protein ART_1441 [Arthrobacter sp. PAMC 25486]|uniref:alpha/beta hydrolase n=1 Tax=Arthrobacter sp. PAMC 25486 TaxID=1494608 RepID=UPI0005362661|nr:alpha/beta hydrolase-fold protein [Arthrobacter sp. PAMC 25486]AIY01040.1 hypothetical protein ART_1441 [Arthrobacter sp. PAMC 25486]
MNAITELSLVDGPVPIVLWALCAAGLGALLVRRSWRWWLFGAAAAVAAALLSMVAGWAVIHLFYWWAEDLPSAVILNLAIALWALTMGCTTAFAGLRRRPGRRLAHRSSREVRSSSRAALRTSPARRILAVVATVVVLAVSGLQVNAYFGEYPTVGSLLGQQPAVSTMPLPVPHHSSDSRFMTTAVASGWQQPAGLPRTGTVLAAKIPGTVSGFHGRDALVYLPPAYFAAQRPVLPVVVLVSGQPGSPESWLRSTNLVYDLDAYAASHGGLAPLVVLPDPNGSDEKNTMCMDSALARAGKYMSTDVPNWIKSHLDADTNPAHWAIGGFSYGATCSLQMATRHPDVFQTFMAVAPEREPALASKRSVTIGRAFHGDAAAFDSQLPLTLMARNNYPNTHGWFASGSSDVTYSANVKVLQKAARRAGMTTESATFPGGHSWSVANEALKPGLAFVYTRIGLP